MSGAATLEDRPGLHPRVQVAKVGRWWTYDAPSLRVPDADGRYLSLWSVGVGPSVLLVPPSTSHEFWIPVLEDLESSYTVHAMDRREDHVGALPSSLTGIEEEDILQASWSVGAEAVVSCGGANPLALGAMSRSDRLRAAVLVAAPGDRMPSVRGPGGGFAFVDARWDVDSGLQKAGPDIAHALIALGVPGLPSRRHVG